MVVDNSGVDVVPPCSVAGSGCPAGIVAILSGGLSDELDVVVAGPAVFAGGLSCTCGPAGSRVKGVSLTKVRPNIIRYVGQGMEVGEQASSTNPNHRLGAYLPRPPISHRDDGSLVWRCRSAFGWVET